MQFRNQISSEKQKVFCFWPHRASGRFLVPQQGIEPVPPALGAQSLNHWTAREVPEGFFFFFYII